MKSPFLLSSMCLALILSGCSTGPTDFSSDYQAALAARPGVVLRDADAGRQSAARFMELYSDLAPDRTKSLVRDVYAKDAWFNDTIATEVGIDAIERYLLKTARGAQSVRVKVDNLAVSGPDCYVRWTMTVQTKSLAGGRPIITAGMSQLRFDEDGRVVLQQDFWNPAAGIYQHLPLLGPAIRFVNSLIIKPE